MVLVWLFDLRGGYALLMIDAETGKSEEFPLPFPPGGDCPYSSILSSDNKFYTHFNSHFVEFDPAERAFTFYHKTAPQMAMSMTEDDDGVIWSATYPQSGLVLFNPKTREFKDYGHLYKQNWRQYPRSVAADDTGWIYFGIGSTASQIISVDPNTATAAPLVSESERVHGSGTVYRDLNGKVYGHVGGDGGKWYELYQGKSRAIDHAPDIRKKPIITSSQGLFHRDFPDGKILRTCDLVDRILEVEDPENKQVKKLAFDYHSEGAHIMGLAVAPDGTICGGTAFPMRFFRYDPENDTWTNHASLRPVQHSCPPGQSILRWRLWAWLSAGMGSGPCVDPDGERKQRKQSSLSDGSSPDDQPSARTARSPQRENVGAGGHTWLRSDGWRVAVLEQGHRAADRSRAHRHPATAGHDELDCPAG